ncbi:MAG: DUF5131 family protein [Nitrososphaerota archaeon]|nr:DUF5131 family protein [Nitrososphaerota archaeon]
MKNTQIEWTHATFNFAWGCRKVDRDPLTGACANCFAERLMKRYGFDFETLRWLDLGRIVDSISKLPKEKKLIFLMDMSDIFGEFFADETILSWHKKVIEVFPDREFQLLTKRIGRAMAFYRKYYNSKPPRNIWIGASVGSKDRLFRLDQLRRIEAKIRYVSFEPLLGDLGQIDLTGIQWVIVGGESGPNHRPIKEEWVRSIRDQARVYGASFFFKQWGGLFPGGPALLDGRVWHEFPGGWQK